MMYSAYKLNKQDTSIWIFLTFMTTMGLLPYKFPSVPLGFSLGICMLTSPQLSFVPLVNTFLIPTWYHWQDIPGSWWWHFCPQKACSLTREADSWMNRDTVWWALWFQQDAATSYRVVREGGKVGSLNRLQVLICLSWFQSPLLQIGWHLLILIVCVYSQKHPRLYGKLFIEGKSL